jgi:hypothetical protein
MQRKLCIRNCLNTEIHGRNHGINAAKRSIENGGQLKCLESRETKFDSE